MSDLQPQAPSRDVALDMYALLRAANQEADAVTVAAIINNVDHDELLENLVGFTVAFLRVGYGSAPAVDAFLGTLTTDTFTNTNFHD